MKYYAGIGARKTPNDVLEYMEIQGKLLAEKGYVLRSGGAKGADSAFEKGCDSVRGLKQIWSTRNKHEWEEHDWVIPIISRACWEKPFLSMQMHTQRLLGRNTYQLYGDPKLFEDCVKSKFVLYWSQPENGENCSGGTRYAIRMAVEAEIPCFNLYNESEKAEYEATFGNHRNMYSISKFVPEGFKQELLSFLLNQQVTQKQGPRWTEPRLTCWFSKNNVNYTYSGITHKPLPWVANLDVLCYEIYRVYQANRIEAEMPNSIMVNVYRDGEDYCSKHSDDEDLFGANPTIASLSFGATRDFQIFQQNQLLDTYALEDNDLLIMGPGFQEKYMHAVPKSKATSWRLNLTFRYIP